MRKSVKAPKSSLTADTVFGWFGAVLDKGDPRPNRSACIKLARGICAAAERENVCVNPLEEKKNELIDGIIDAVRHLLFTLDQAERFGINVIHGPGEDLTSDQIREFVGRLGVLVGRQLDAPKISETAKRNIQIAVTPLRNPDGSISYDNVIDRLAKKGLFKRSEEGHGESVTVQYTGIARGLTSAHKKAWSPDLGRQFAELIRNALWECGYRKSLSEHTPGNATTIIAAKAMTWATGKTISPDAFVTGLRDRIRRRKGRD